MVPRMNLDKHFNMILPEIGGVSMNLFLKAYRSTLMIPHTNSEISANVFSLLLTEALQ